MLGDEERQALEEKIKVQGENVRKLKEAKADKEKVSKVSFL